MKPRVYIAAAFFRARFVDTIVAPALTARGFEIGSTWHQPPYPIEDASTPREIGEGLHTMRLEDVRELAERNDHALATSDVVLVLADNGRETLCEARLAVSIGLEVVWEGARCLSAYREGVVRVPSLAAAYDVLAGMRAERWPSGRLSPSRERVA